MNTEDQVRQDQLTFGRQMDGVQRTRKTLHKKPLGAPKGHEAFLKALEGSGAVVEFEKVSSGDKVIGKIKAADKYTVSIMVPVTPDDYDGPYITRVLFKHDISEFSPLTNRPADAALH